MAPVISEHQKSFSDCPNAARHSGSRFPLNMVNIALDNRSYRYYGTEGNLGIYLLHLGFIHPENTSDWNRWSALVYLYCQAVLIFTQ